MQKLTYALVVSLAVPTLLLCAACKDDPKPVALAETASAVAAAAPPATAKVMPYAIDPASKTSIDMPAPNEHIQADTTAAAGKLDVDLMNVENTRGEVKIDLTSLTIHVADHTADQNKQQTEPRRRRTSMRCSRSRRSMVRARRTCRRWRR
jgi:hypothetical protein